MSSMKSVAVGLVGVVAFAAFGISGLAVFSHAHGDAGMLCPVMGHAAVLCPMSLIEHLARWQSLSLAVENTPMMFAAFVFLLGVLLLHKLWSWDVFPLLFRRLVRSVQADPVSFRGSEFALLLRGILHSRLYA